MKINSLIQTKVIIFLLSCSSLINAAEAFYKQKDRETELPANGPKTASAAKEPEIEFPANDPDFELAANDQESALAALKFFGWSPPPKAHPTPPEIVSTLPLTAMGGAKDTALQTPSIFCERCNTPFLNPVSLHNHRSKAKRAEGQGLLCDIPTCCSFFKDIASKRKHIRTRHEEKEIYGCSGCERKFKIKASGRIHSNTAHKEGQAHLTIECEKCSLFYDYGTRNHTCETGASRDLLPPVATPPTPKCPFCAKTFDSWKKERDHQNRVTQAKKNNLCCDVPGCCSVSMTLELKEKHMREFHPETTHGATQSKRSRLEEETAWGDTTTE